MCAFMFSHSIYVYMCVIYITCMLYMHMYNMYVCAYMYIYSMLGFILLLNVCTYVLQKAYTDTYVYTLNIFLFLFQISPSEA